jgi:hypothetical protein
MIHTSLLWFATTIQHRVHTTLLTGYHMVIKPYTIYITLYIHVHSPSWSFVCFHNVTPDDSLCSRWWQLWLIQLFPISRGVAVAVRAAVFARRAQAKWKHFSMTMCCWGVFSHTALYCTHCNECVSEVMMVWKRWLEWERQLLYAPNSSERVSVSIRSLFLLLLAEITSRLLQWLTPFMAYNGFRLELSKNDYAKSDIFS